MKKLKYTLALLLICGTAYAGSAVKGLLVVNEGEQIIQSTEPSLYYRDLDDDSTFRVFTNSEYTIDYGSLTGISPSDDWTSSFSFMTLSSDSTMSIGSTIAFRHGTTQWNSGDDIDATKVADADLGDILTNSGVWTVQEDALSLSDLSDVGTSTSTSGNVLVGDGTNFDARALIDSDIPSTITIDLAATATAAAADGTDCAVGSYARGVDVSWNGEGCTDASTEIDSIVATHTSDNDAHQALVTLAGQDYLTLSTQQITAGEIEPDDLAASDFGEFACNGTTCTVDSTHSGSAHHAAVTLAGTPNYLTLSTQEITMTKLDISDDTNMTGGRSLTLTANDMLADAELYTVTKCGLIETPTAADNFVIYHVELGMQITAVHCIVEDATSATVEIEQCDVAGDNCTVVTTALVCDVGGQADDGTIDNPDLDVDDWVRMDVTAISGTPGHVTACFTATMDD